MSSPVSHGEEQIDYVVVHRALGQPRYTIRFYFIYLTTFEAFFSIVVMVTAWWIIGSLELSDRLALGFISWELLPFALLIIFPLGFSIVHHARPDLKIWETVTGAFAPRQYKDFPDKTWKPVKRRKDKRFVELKKSGRV